MTIPEQYEEEFEFLYITIPSCLKGNIFREHAGRGAWFADEVLALPRPVFEEFEKSCPRQHLPLGPDGKPVMLKGRTGEFAKTVPYTIVHRQEREAYEAEENKKAASQIQKLVCLVPVGSHKTGDLIDFANADPTVIALWEGRARSGEGNLYFRALGLHQDMVKIKDALLSQTGISAQDFAAMLNLEYRKMLRREIYELQKRLVSAIEEIKQEPDYEDHYESNVNGRFRLVGPGHMVSAGGITRSNS